MRVWLILTALSLVPAHAFAQGVKSCDDLKSEIAKKVEANGVKSYSLEILPKDQASDKKVVGTCEGGAKKIVYDKSAAPAQNQPAKDSPKP